MLHVKVTKFKAHNIYYLMINRGNLYAFNINCGDVLKEY